MSESDNESKDPLKFSSPIFSASQVVDPIYNRNPVHHYIELENSYAELTGESLPEDFMFDSNNLVGWAEILVEFVTGYQYEPYGDEIVTPTETDLNSVGIIIVLLSLYGEKIWKYPIHDTLTSETSFITLGELRSRLISKLRNNTLLIPNGFLSNLDKILKSAYIY